jgi:hypothetical protein
LYTIICGSEIGPTFGHTTWYELSAFREPFNGNRNCRSKSGGNSYRIPVDKDGINMLTNNKDEEFTITELEVWQVIYLE